MKLPSTKQWKALGNTVVWSAFILFGGFSAMQLRGDIHLNEASQVFLGSGLAVFVLITLFSLVYQANKVK